MRVNMVTETGLVGSYRKPAGPLRQATGPPRSGAGVGVGMLMVLWFYGFMDLRFYGFMVLWFYALVITKFPFHVFRKMLFLYPRFSRIY